MLTPLPVDAHIPEILRILRHETFLVVTAPPGAGKTTRIPPALAESGRVICLQPRRVAARALTRRIASERGWNAGDEVGWQIRFERKFSERTRLIIATEGILTARLQSDPLLSDFSTVILDEFHERSAHADLAIALVRQAAKARGDLRVVVMSATLDARAVSGFLGNCPVVEIPGRLHPVSIEYAPGVSMTDAVARELSRDGGHVLCFLPGAREIRDAAVAVRAKLPGLPVFELHGNLDVDSQEAALAPSAARKVILATNIAETSITVEGVTSVVDAGLQRVMRYDRGRGIDRLVTERVSRDASEQRAGRAGRIQAGRTVRLWDQRDILDEHREPEIHRIDLASILLDIIAWGDDPLEFEWFASPAKARIEEDLELLSRIGALRDRQLTPLGRQLQRLPVHPRLGNILVEAGGSRDAARAIAILAEGRRWKLSSDETCDSDLVSLVDEFRDAPRAVRDGAEEFQRLATQLGIKPGSGVPLMRALLSGFPDRVARRRAAGSPRLLLCSGTGAVLGRESSVRGGEYLLALDTFSGEPGTSAEAIVRMASIVDRDWLEPTRVEVVHRLDGHVVRAASVDWYDAIALAERPVSPDPAVASEILVAELVRRGPDESMSHVIRRAKFAGIDIDLEAIYRQACSGRTKMPDIDLVGRLTHADRSRLDRLAPEAIPVPSGRSAKLEYRDDGEVVASVKLQELFGLADTPRIGPRKTPVTIALLAPNGRPVQVTRDLSNFWHTTYAEVRKELRGRYPKHPWPEDPWTAEPTARARRKR